MSKKKSLDHVLEAERSQPHAGGSSEGAGVSPGVHNESTFVLKLNGSLQPIKDDSQDASSLRRKVEGMLGWGYWAIRNV
ncbi:hypothetical protein Tco_0369429 [Tanacetum coccineum]